MSQFPSVRPVARVTFFLLISGSKTLVNIGQACLTVSATVLTLNRLAQANQKSVEFSDAVYGVDITSQFVAAVFSTLIVALTRYPATWNKLNILKLRRQLNDLDYSVKWASKKMKFTLALISFFGFLSCVARGISAYLGVEVILSERAHLNSSFVTSIAWIAVITVTIQSVFFNLSNMVMAAAQRIQNPLSQFRPSILLSLLAALSYAVAMRFFIEAFLSRRNVSVFWQVFGQTVFSLSEFVLNVFTVVTSFKAGWWKKAKETLQHSWLLTSMIVGDVITTWLGYSTITWYSMLIAPIPTTNNESVNWALMGLACCIGIPTTLAYVHYLLSYAKDGYEATLNFKKNLNSQRRFGIFEWREPAVMPSLDRLPLVDAKYRIQF